jgi:hypothetical protein
MIYSSTFSPAADDSSPLVLLLSSIAKFSRSPSRLRLASRFSWAPLRSRSTFVSSFKVDSPSLRALRAAASSGVFFTSAWYRTSPAPSPFSTFINSSDKRGPISTSCGFLSPHICRAIAGQDSDHLRVPSCWKHPTESRHQPNSRIRNIVLDKVSYSAMPSDRCRFERQSVAFERLVVSVLLLHFDPLHQRLLL